MIEIQREDDGRRGRFVAYEDGVLAGEMTYAWSGPAKFIITHTGVEPAFEGKGIGKKMVEKSIEFAQQEGKKIRPLCPFAKKYFDKFPEKVENVKY